MLPIRVTLTITLSIRLWQAWENSFQPEMWPSTRLIYQWKYFWKIFLVALYKVWQRGWNVLLANCSDIFILTLDHAACFIFNFSIDNSQDFQIIFKCCDIDFGSFSLPMLMVLMFILILNEYFPTFVHTLRENQAYHLTFHPPLEPGNSEIDMWQTWPLVIGQHT